MPAFINIVDSASANIAAVDNDRQVQVVTNRDPTKAGAVLLYDSLGRPLLTTENGSLATSFDQVMFWDQIDGNAVNTNRWTYALSGMTIAQANGFITLNNAGAVTAGAYAVLSTIKSLPFYGYLPLKVSIVANITTAAQSNATTEIGIGLAATTAAPTDGAFFRHNSSGQLVCVVNNAGVETASASLVPPTVNDQVLYQITVVEDLVQFHIDDVLMAEVEIPITQAFPTASGRLPVFCRVYNGGSSPAIAPKLNIGQVLVVQQAANQNRVWKETLVSVGNHAIQSPTVFTQLANNANSANPAAATLSNTAAGYATLGGRFLFSTLASAATDYALFAFQVPAGYQLFVTGVWVSTSISTILGAGGLLLDWSLGVNSSGVSLATADSPPTSWAPRRLGLGVQSLLTLAAVGQGANDISRNFDPPLVVDGGRFIHVILQTPTSPATGAVRGQVTINGYFE